MSTSPDDFETHFFQENNMADNKELLGQIYQDIAQTQATQQAMSVVKRVRFNAERVKNVALLDQLSREVTGGAPPPLVPRRLGPVVLDTGNLTFDDNTPVNMQGNLTFLPGGNWNFTVHMHNSGGVSMDGDLVIGIVFHGIASPEPFFVKQISGHMGGIFGGSRSFDDSQSSPGPNGFLSDCMNRANGYDWTINYGANWTLSDLVNDAKDALQVGGVILSAVSFL
jgi:hypothetical protein